MPLNTAFEGPKRNYAFSEGFRGVKRGLRKADSLANRALFPVFSGTQQRNLNRTEPVEIDWDFHVEDGIEIEWEAQFEDGIDI